MLILHSHDPVWASPIKWDPIGTFTRNKDLKAFPNIHTHSNSTDLGRRHGNQKTTGRERELRGMIGRIGKNGIGKWRNQGESWESARKSTSSFSMLKITSVSLLKSSKSEILQNVLQVKEFPASAGLLSLLLTSPWLEHLLVTDHSKITLLPSMQLQAMNFMVPEPPWRLPSWSRIWPLTLWQQSSFTQPCFPQIRHLNQKARNLSQGV